GLLETLLGVSDLLFLQGVHALFVSFLGVLRSRQRNRAYRPALFLSANAMQQDRAYIWIVHWPPSRQGDRLGTVSRKLRLEIAAHIFPLLRVHRAGKGRASTRSRHRPERRRIGGHYAELAGILN